MKQSFNSTLHYTTVGVPMTVAFVPFSVEKTFGTKGKVDIKGTIDGLPIQRTLMPAGNGEHFLIINVEMRKAIGKDDGDAVFIEIEPDETYKDVEMPDYFLYELEENVIGKIEFECTSPSNKRWMQKYLMDGKSMDTKANRVLKVLEMLVRNSARRKGKVKNKTGIDT
jgi:hypothetical protein